MQLSLGGPVNLPKIRDDIEIFDGGSNKYSSPTWVIYDPVIEKFYRIGWVEHEIISNWHIGNPEAICQKINQSTTIKISPANIERIVKFLSMHNLLQFDDHEHADKLYDYYAKMRAGRFARFLQQYLFLRLPLLRPDRFLSKTLPYIKFLFSKKILYLIIVIGILGSYFVVRNWSQFVSHYDYFFTFESMAMLFIILAITKMFHELGHAYTAKYYGCSVSTMGVALLVLFPILYTDTTDTWRLKSRSIFSFWTNVITTRRGV